MYPAAASRLREMVSTSWLKSGLSSGSAFQHSSIIAYLPTEFHKDKTLDIDQANMSVLLLLILNMHQ